MRILIVISFLLCNVVAFGQIRPEQVGFPPSDTINYYFANDTVTSSATFGRGIWRPVDSLAIDTSSGGAADGNGLWTVANNGLTAAVSSVVMDKDLVWNRTSGIVITMDDSDLQLNPTTADRALRMFGVNALGIWAEFEEQYGTTQKWRIGAAGDDDFQIWNYTTFAVPFKIGNLAPANTLRLLDSGLLQAADYTGTNADTINTVAGFKDDGTVIELTADSVSNFIGFGTEIVEDYTALKAYNKRFDLVYVSNDSLSGFFQKDTATATIDSALVFLAADGSYWHRIVDDNRYRLTWWNSPDSSWTNELQTAIDYISPKGGTLVIDTGTFLMNWTDYDTYQAIDTLRRYCVELKSNVRIEMHPLTVLKLADAQVLDDTLPRINMFIGKYIENVYIGGGTMDGNTEGQTWSAINQYYGQNNYGNHIRIYGHSDTLNRNITIENLRMINHSSCPVHAEYINGVILNDIYTERVGEGLELKYCDNVFMNNYTHYDSTNTSQGDGLEYANCDTVFLNNININGFGNGPGDGIDLFASRNVTLTNFQVNGWNSGITAEYNGYEADNIVIANGTITNSKLYGMKGGDGNIRINNVIIRDAPTAGIWLRKTASSVDGDINTVSDAQIIDCGTGIQVTDYKELRLNDVDIIGSTTFGIYVYENNDDLLPTLQMNGGSITGSGTANIRVVGDDSSWSPYISLNGVRTVDNFTSNFAPCLDSTYYNIIGDSLYTITGQIKARDYGGSLYQATSGTYVLTPDANGNLFKLPIDSIPGSGGLVDKNIAEDDLTTDGDHTVAMGLDTIRFSNGYLTNESNINTIGLFMKVGTGYSNKGLGLYEANTLRGQLRTIYSTTAISLDSWNGYTLELNNHSSHTDPIYFRDSDGLYVYGTNTTNVFTAYNSSSLAEQFKITNNNGQVKLGNERNANMYFRTNATDQLSILNTGQVGLLQYLSGSTFTGTPFNLLAHEADGDVISATWAQVLDSLETNGLATGGVDIQESDATIVADAAFLDFGSGFDVTETPTGEANVEIDISEFSTDVAAEGDESILMYDPSTGQEELIDVNNLPYVATEVDGSVTNEIDTWDIDSADDGVGSTNIGDGETVTIDGTGGIVATLSGNTMTIDGSGVTGSSLWTQGTNLIYNNTDDVGIGTSAPDVELHVLGGPSAAIQLESTSANPELRIKGNRNTTGLTARIDFKNEDPGTFSGLEYYMFSIEANKTATNGFDDNQLIFEAFKSDGSPDLMVLHSPLDSTDLQGEVEIKEAGLIISSIKTITSGTSETQTPGYYAFFITDAASSFATFNLLDASTTLGREVFIFNESGGSIDIDPPTGDEIDGVSAGTAIALANNTGITLFAIGSNDWVTK